MKTIITLTAILLTSVNIMAQDSDKCRKKCADRSAHASCKTNSPYEKNDQAKACAGESKKTAVNPGCCKEHTECKKEVTGSEVKKDNKIANK